MKKLLLCAMITVLGCSVLLLGCVKKSGSTAEAIDLSKTLQTVEQKVAYLVGQAQAFLNAKQYQDAVNIAQYILSAVDQNSTQAKSIIQKAKDALMAKGSTAVSGVTKKLGL